MLRYHHRAIACSEKCGFERDTRWLVRRLEEMGHVVYLDREAA